MRAELEFVLPEDKFGSSSLIALRKGKKSKRCKTTLALKNKKLRIIMDANDATALRAAANSNLRIFDMLLNVWEVVLNGR